MPSTILSVLTRPNPPVRPQNIRASSNTIGRYYLDVESWVPWRDFNYKTLKSIFPVVNASWEHAPAKVKFSRLDSTFSDEDGFEHQILDKELIPTVNAALEHARHVLGFEQDQELNLGRRGRCQYGEDGRLHPDWALVCEGVRTEDGSFVNILPGDSKVSARWTPDLYETKFLEWQKPVQQVLTYANEVNARYGFIITDAHLAVFEYAREHVDPGIATSRGTRSQTHQRVLSEDSLVSSTQAMSLTAESRTTDSYAEPDRGLEFRPPKYKVIPWGNKGKGVLTVKLALFYLSLMAGYGWNDIQTRYPRLNTWCQLSDGTFRHNSSGTMTKKIGSKDKVEAPYPEEVEEYIIAPVDDDYNDDHEEDEEGEEEEGEQEVEEEVGVEAALDEMEEEELEMHPNTFIADASERFIESDGVYYFTRKAVESMRFDTSENAYAHDRDDGDVDLIFEDSAIYDTAAGAWGCFRGRSWVQSRGEANTLQPESSSVSREQASQDKRKGKHREGTKKQKKDDKKDDERGGKKDGKKDVSGTKRRRV